MVTLGLNFDILFILIMITFIMIGYITGANVELIKLIKIYIPFIVVFYLGGPISRWIYKSGQFKKLIEKVSFINGMAYFNTFIMFLSTFIAFFGTYLIIGLIIKFVQKRIQSEIVTYKLGKFNNKLGGLIAIIRFYVIISILILPFFILGFTSTNQFSTNLVLKYPPPYTQIGRLVNSSQPVLNASNSLSTFMEVVDVNKLKEYYNVVTDLETTLDGYEQQVDNTCEYTPGTGQYPLLHAYVNDPSQCMSEELSSILPYKGLIMWVSEDDVDLSNLTNDELIEAFNDKYDYIYNHTDDISMKSTLEKAHKSSEIYLVVNKWLKETLGGSYDIANLLNDDNMKTIIDQLVIDHANENTEGLFFELYQLDNDELDQKLVSIGKFVKNYTEIYEPIMNTMPEQLPFKYKLIASTLKNFNFMPPLERTPLMAMYVIDTFKLLDEANMKLMDDEPIYRTLVKIVIPLYLLKPDENGIMQTYTAEDMQDLLTKHCDKNVCSIDDAFNKVIITEDFFIELMYALTDDEDGDIQSYLEYLITDQPDTNRPLMEKEVVDVLEDYFNEMFKNSDDERVQAIKDSLSEVGDVNG
ncbi:CvpA family protein [Mycoplasmatota bacterium]|nr:CvpA family protein [Mycoplasmatota bacterium]